jgi:hypothetical protein
LLFAAQFVFGLARNAGFAVCPKVGHAPKIAIHYNRMGKNNNTPVEF